MGWRDRDYARFTDEEFAAIYGDPRQRRSSGPPPSSPVALPFGTPSSPRRRRHRYTRLRGFVRSLAIIVAAVAATAAILGALIVTGQIDAFADIMNGATATPPVAANVRAAPKAPIRVETRPFVPTAPSPPKPVARVGLIIGTRLLRQGSVLRLHGTHMPEPGSIVIRGRWGSSGSWETFSVARGSTASYSLAVPLTHRGVLHLRIDYPDGYRAVGTYRVE
ncbi:MAG: hypothetical protein ACRDM1_02025 [Gaiellaceae bacterium]